MCFVETRIIEENSLQCKEPNPTVREVSELVVDYNHVQICQCLAASKISKLSIIETALTDISGGEKNNFA